MKVKTRVEHGNGYGDKYLKAKGDEYEVPDVHAGPLIAAKLVAEVKPAADKSSGKGDNGADG